MARRTKRRNTRKGSGKRKSRRKYVRKYKNARHKTRKNKMRGGGRRYQAAADGVDTFSLSEVDNANIEKEINVIMGKDYRDKGSVIFVNNGSHKITLINRDNTHLGMEMIQTRADGGFGRRIVTEIPAPAPAPAPAPPAPAPVNGVADLLASASPFWARLGSVFGDQGWDDVDIIRDEFSQPGGVLDSLHSLGYTVNHEEEQRLRQKLGLATVGDTVVSRIPPELTRLLQVSDLEKYGQKFVEEGYDDVGVILAYVVNVLKDINMTPPEQSRLRIALGLPALCKQCGIKPVHVDKNGYSHPFCGRYCAGQNAKGIQPVIP